MRRRPPIAARRLLLLAAWAACSACTGDPGPEGTLDDYLAALRSGDAESAWRLTDPQVREGTTLEAFRVRFEAGRAAAVERLEAARASGWGEAELTATLDQGGALPLRMVRGPDGWRITEGVLDEYSQDTPRQALVSFVRAMERQRWDVVLRFVPSRLRADLDEAALRRHVEANRGEVTAVLERLNRHLEDPIEQDGPRALLRYEGFEAELIREDGAWRVVDPD